MKNFTKAYEENGRKVFEGIGLYNFEEPKDLREMMNNSAIKFGNKAAFKYKENGEIKTKSYIELKADVEALGQSLYDLGLKDEKVAVIGENRYEWGVCYLAVINGLGIGVPLDKHLPKLEIENLIKRSGAKAIFFSKSYLEIMEEIEKNDGTVKYYICMDDIENKGKFFSVKYLLEAGKKSLTSGKNEFLTLPIDRDKMSMLLFTSGTTSLSKGVMLCHKNITSNVRTIANLIKVYDNDIYLSLLPLHHTLENTIGLMFMIYMGVPISYCEGLKHVADNIQEFDVTALIAVPAIYEVMYSKIQDGIKKSGKEKTINNLINFSNSLRKIHIDLRKPLFSVIRNKVGKNLRLMISGAAPIDVNIAKFFEDIGITFIQGFGLTETAPLVCVNNPFKNLYDTVGFPMERVKVALDNIDNNGMGELLVKGDLVMLGYYENDEATKEAFTDDGWFKTGDLAIISDEGAVKITGRAKSMIVFENGKKAFPEEYEVLLNRIETVKDSFVFGQKSPDGNTDICAKIVLKEKVDEKEAIKIIDEKIKEINNTLPKYKILRYFVVTNEELVKTTTLKIKRNIEKEKIDKLLKDKNSTMRKLNKTKV